jgi:SRSO17 transposase
MMVERIADTVLANEWRAELSSLQDRLGFLFVRSEARRQAGLYLEGLLSAAERKNGWQLAEEIGDARPWRTQRVLSQSQWNEATARDVCRGYVLDHLAADRDGMLIVDETAFTKKGEHSVGVAKQYSGLARRVVNCQVGVFLASVSDKGQALIDRALYLPQSWIADKERCRAASVPDGVGFATKPELAWRMIERALDAGMRPAFVLGDEVYGRDKGLRVRLEARGVPYLLTADRDELVLLAADGVATRVDAWAAAQPAAAWRRLSAGVATKGERWFDWLCLPRPHQPAWPWSRSLLVRRNVHDPQECAYFVVFAPAHTPLATLVRAAGRRWAIEECFEAAKQEVGLGDYEVRSWHGWHRHITLAMLALALLAVLRARLRATTTAANTDGTAEAEKGPRGHALWSTSRETRSAVLSPASKHSPGNSPSSSSSLGQAGDAPTKRRQTTRINGGK